MKRQDRELLDALIAPFNKARESWKSVKLVTRPSQSTSKTAPVPKRAKVRGGPKKQEELPRGIHRRGRSLQVYLTRADGHGYRRSVGNVSVKMAKQQREIWQREIAEGRYVKKVPRVERVLFENVADRGLDYAKNYKRSWDTDSGRIKRMKEWWGKRPADSITTEMINERLLENTASRGLCWSEATSNEYRALVARIYKLAIDDGKFGLTVNPATKAHRYKLNNSRRRELSAEEETRLRAALRTLYPHKELELDLALHLGCRRSNLYGIHGKGRKDMAPLDWNDVDLNWKIVRFPRAKAGLSYTVPLNDIALAALTKLRERSDGTGPVIRKPSGRELHSCRKWFEKCLEKAGVSDFRWHDLRHTFASRLRRAGVAIEDIADLLDHKIPGLRMVTRYAHADVEKLRSAVATLVKAEGQTDTKTDTPPVVEFRNRKAV